MVLRGISFQQRRFGSLDGERFDGKQYLIDASGL